MALLYLQVAGLMEAGQSDDGGLKKNLTVALARVSMRTIFDDLRPAEQAWLRANKNALIGLLQQTYSGKAGKWQDVPDELPQVKGENPNERRAREKVWKKDLERATELIPGLLRRPIQGAFGEANDDPEASFGKMTVVAQAEPVGPGEKPEDRRGGYALELRKFPGLSTGNRTKLTATVRDLIANSRRVHGTDVPIAPNVVPQVVVPATLPPPATLLVVVTPAPTTDKY